MRSIISPLGLFLGSLLATACFQAEDASVRGEADEETDAMGTSEAADDDGNDDTNPDDDGNDEATSGPGDTTGDDATTGPGDCMPAVWGQSNWNEGCWQ